MSEREIFVRPVMPRTWIFIAFAAGFAFWPAIVDSDAMTLNVCGWAAAATFKFLNDRSLAVLECAIEGYEELMQTKTED